MSQEIEIRWNRWVPIAIAIIASAISLALFGVSGLRSDEKLILEKKISLFRSEVETLETRATFLERELVSSRQAFLILSNELEQCKIRLQSAKPKTLEKPPKELPGKRTDPKQAL